MGQDPFGVGALPAGEGVGGKATVDQGDVRLVLRVLQIQEVLPQLPRIQLALVYNGFCWQSTDIVSEILLGDIMGTELPQKVHLALEFR